ncbi:hypothetical protein F5B19DRAFT_461965 [Rostrohypoxylon terebratum]|nr:hypothetical protein F5B19DRAFT_461965 [Rostrohypoxylon terebratum]
MVDMRNCSFNSLFCLFCNLILGYDRLHLHTSRGGSLVGPIDRLGKRSYECCSKANQPRCMAVVPVDSVTNVGFLFLSETEVTEFHELGEVEEILHSLRIVDDCPDTRDSGIKGRSLRRSLPRLAGADPEARSVLHRQKHQDGCYVCTNSRIVCCLDSRCLLFNQSGSLSWSFKHPLIPIQPDSQTDYVDGIDFLAWGKRI